MTPPKDNTQSLDNKAETISEVLRDAIYAARYGDKTARTRHTEALATIEKLLLEVIGEPLKDDITYTPTLGDPYGLIHMMDTTKTSVPKYNWNYGSVETVKRQHARLKAVLYGEDE